MRLIIFLIFIFLFNFSFAQSPVQTIVVGDTVLLKISQYTGNIQWQSSTDSLVWLDLSGYNDSLAQFIASSSPTNQTYYRAKVTDALCPNATPIYSSITKHKIVANISEIQIGEWYRGGIVYYNDGMGQGQISSPIDNSPGIYWGCSGTFISNSASISDGITNTNSIYSGCNTRPIAASVCYDLNLNGYSDWFLPARDQLDMLYQQKSVIGNFINCLYWSSTQYNASNAYVEDFGAGSPGLDSKTNNSNVRCIRSFQSNNKCVSLFSIINQPQTISITLQPISYTKCINDNISLCISATGTASISYQWKKNGVDIPGAQDDTLILNNITIYDEGLYICEATNLCRSISSIEADIKVIEITTDVGIADNLCPGESSLLQASYISNHILESGTVSYSWSPTTALSASDISNPVASPVITTNYTVTATDVLGCTATDNVEVLVQNPFSNEEICLVTVDTITGMNKIVWTKTPSVGTGNYIVYRQVTGTIYNYVDMIPYTNAPEYIDVGYNSSSTYNRYRISVVDTCGNESVKSPYHQTIHLAVSQGVPASNFELAWNPYVDEGDPLFPDEYYIFRGTTPANMVILDTVPGTVTDFTDQNIFSPYYYSVRVQKTCSVNMVAGSNVVFNDIVGNNLLNTSGSINISPNPMNSFATLEIPNLNLSNGHLTILDITGKLVRTEPLTPDRHPELVSGSPHSQITINRGDLKPGIYFLELKADKIYRGKLVVE